MVDKDRLIETLSLSRRKEAHHATELFKQNEVLREQLDRMVLGIKQIDALLDHYHDDGSTISISDIQGEVIDTLGEAGVE